MATIRASRKAVQSRATLRVNSLNCRLRCAASTEYTPLGISALLCLKGLVRSYAIFSDCGCIILRCKANNDPRRSRRLKSRFPNSCRTCSHADVSSLTPPLSQRSGAEAQSGCWGIRQGLGTIFMAEQTKCVASDDHGQTSTKVKFEESAESEIGSGSLQYSLLCTSLSHALPQVPPR